MDCSWADLYRCLDPILFSIGSFTIYWYAAFFFLGWLAAYGVAQSYSQRLGLHLSREELFDFFLWLLLGALIGGRLGYALFYYPQAFWESPLRLILPYDPSSGAWTGIAGMSYYGGLLGVGLVLALYAQQKRLSFWQLGDLLALSAPIAIFFGRLGNFFNAELPGRLTAEPWGMAFPGLEGLRHPVMLYEALGEGVVLFFLMLLLLRYRHRAGDLFIGYLISYGLLRFGLEFFREPDPQIGFLLGIFTLGQLFSLLLAGSGFFLWFRRQKYVTITSD